MNTLKEVYEKIDNQFMIADKKRIIDTALELNDTIDRLEISTGISDLLKATAKTDILKAAEYIQESLEYIRGYKDSFIQSRIELIKSLDV